jgi:hypothetical protein
VEERGQSFRAERPPGLAPRTKGWEDAAETADTADLDQV